MDIEVKIYEDIEFPVGDDEFLTLKAGERLIIETQDSPDKDNPNDLEESQYTFGFNEPLVVDTISGAKIPASEEELDIISREFALTDLEDLDDRDDTIFNKMLDEYESLETYKRDPHDFVDEYAEKYIEKLDQLVTQIDEEAEFRAEYEMSDDMAGDLAYLTLESNFMYAHYDREFETVAKEAFGEVEDALEYLYHQGHIEGQVYPAMSSGPSEDNWVILGSYGEYGMEVEHQLGDEIADTLEDLTTGELEYIRRNLNSYMGEGDTRFVYTTIDDVYYYVVDKDDAIEMMNDYIER